jgi:predicted amidohydrolase
LRTSGTGGTIRDKPIPSIEGISVMSPRRRPIRVATISHRPEAGVDGPEGLNRLMKKAEALLERAHRMGADLVAFSEHYPQTALSDRWHRAEPSHGGTLARVRQAARRHRLWVVWPRLEYDPDHGLRNTAVLIDRDGQVAGRYDKMFPTVEEIEHGVIPGTEVPCFETDFGRVGLLICFDLNFPEVHEALAKGRPDVVVFSSMYRGGLQAQALAFELGTFVVTAISSELGLIIDRCGRVIKESTYETLAVAPINTNSVALHMDFNWDKMDDMLAKYGTALTFDYHTREGFYVIESTLESDIAELVREFNLEPADAYFARSRRARVEALEKNGGRFHRWEKDRKETLNFANSQSFSPR